MDSNFNGCYDLTMLSVKINDIATITVENVDYRCITHNISKYKAINLVEILFLKVMGIYKNVLS